MKIKQLVMAACMLVWSLSAAGAATAVEADVKSAATTLADAPKPVKVFILAGQSNMEGQAVADLDGKDYNNGKGTLKALMNDPVKASLFKHLKSDKGEWTVRADVWVRYQPENGALRAGPLTLGFTPYAGKHHFGPELQFGHVIGDHVGCQVLLIKTAWGGKSLYKDFRPPSSGGAVGTYYRKMLAEVRQALASLKTDFPGYRGQGYELVGFVWYHGWNDGVDPKNAVPEYEQNLVNLIKDVRKNLKAPKLPVVVGELTGPWVQAPGAWATLRQAQANAARRPEFKGTAVFVETHDFVRLPKDSPNPGHGHHEFGNAETYFLVGDALARGMIKLLSEARQPPPLPTSHTKRDIEGWTVHIDTRLLSGTGKELGDHALRILANRLYDIRHIVPADKVARLQKVNIWIDKTHGKLRPAQYHPSAGWLKGHGYSPELAKCVHIPSAADFAGANHQTIQPWSVLHELAHAYHDQVLGFNHSEIRAAWERFRDSGKYKSVLHINGKKTAHYGLTNPMEFFAEMTESYFGHNDFYPFNRAELQREEPEIFALLTKIWGPLQTSRRQKENAHGSLAAIVNVPHRVLDPHWPRFRGPNADGVAKDDARLPDTWSKKENVKWVADVPGWGLSCPIVWGDKVFLTTVVSDGDKAAPKKGLYLGQGVRTPAKGVHHWLVYCFDLETGKMLWKHEAHTGKPKVPRHPKSSYAAETPTTDGKRLYVLFGDLGLYCYDLGGKQLWSHKIEAKKTFFNYGAAASLVVHDGQVVMLYDNQEGSYLVAFDAETGKQRWRTERDEKSTWATPFIWKNKLRTEVVTCGKRKNRGYDLSGKLLWEFDGRMSNLVIPSPFAANDMLYITSGYVGDAQRPVHAIKPGASGDVSLKGAETSNGFIAWFQPKAGPYNPSPIVYGRYYYTLFDFGFLTCHDAQTGKEVYGKQRFPGGSSFTASPWAYNGKLFFLSEDGKTFVVKSGLEFELVHTNDLDELCLSTPAVSQGNLLIRTASKLYCITSNSPGKSIQK